jgi:hypothetical protein
MQGTGAANSRTVSVQAGANLCVKTNSKLITESGSTVDLQNGTTATIGAAVTWGASHVGTYEAGTTITHNGATTYGPGATVLHSASSNLSIASTNTLLVGATNRIKLTARDVVRQQSLLHAVVDDVTLYSGVYSPRYLPGSGRVRLENYGGGPARTLMVPLQLIHGSVLTNVRVQWSGTAAAGVFSVTASVRAGVTTLSTSTSTSTSLTFNFGLTTEVDLSLYTYRLNFEFTTGLDVSLIEVVTTSSVNQYVEG